MGRARRVQEKENAASIERMKASYREAKSIGDREEEARWANQIGHAYKSSGEYVEARTWFLIDYDIVSALKAAGACTAASLMPTCQSLGEVYLLLHSYGEALKYQEEHYMFGKESGDLVEQQRASTQLGRTYMDLYENKERSSSEPVTLSETELFQKSKHYVTLSMQLAQTLYENPAMRNAEGSFISELVDSYNNMGMMQMMFESNHEAEKYFLSGLKACNNEELPENHPARSRIHCNLGRLYAEIGEFEKAREHMNLDIKICNVNKHLLDEAKGLNNLADLSVKRRRFEDAKQLYRRARDIVRTLGDEDVFLADINENLRVTSEAEKQMAEFEGEFQELKKLQRLAGRKPGENHSRQEYKQLEKLWEQVEGLQYWDRGLEIAKAMKRVAKLLGDSGKIADAYGYVGTAYYNLREYEKAKKWQMRSMEASKRIKHLEGQATALINLGNALDANGEWNAAIEAYEQAYQRASLEGPLKMLSLQKQALDNMLYGYLLRAEKFERAREIEARLKQLKIRMEIHGEGEQAERCSETESEDEEVDHSAPEIPEKSSGKTPSKTASSHGRKRQRMVLSDDEAGSPEVVFLDASTVLHRKTPVVSTTRERVNRSNESSRSSASGKTDDRMKFENDGECDDLSSCYELMSASINGQVFFVDLKKNSEALTSCWILEDLLRQYKHANPLGPHPILKELIVRGAAVVSHRLYHALLKAKPEEIEVVIAGWIHVPFKERFKRHCQANSLDLPLEKFKVSDGEIDACGCNLDDASILQLYLALDSMDTTFHIKLAHNRLGSSAVASLQKLLSKAKNVQVGLSLDFHSNLLDANALSEISNCSVTMSRLEVLILSNNKLTDRIAYQLSSLLSNAPRLQVLELENCMLTTPTCETLSEALQNKPRFRRLLIGKNNPMAGYALKGLLEQLSRLSRFTDLDISDLQVNSTGVRGIINLIKSSDSLSVLVLKNNPQIRLECWRDIGDAISEKSPELLKLDLTACKIHPDIGPGFYKQLFSISTLLHLSLTGSCINPQALDLLLEELKKPTFHLQKLDLSECGLSHGCVLRVLESLRGNTSLLELRMAGNCREEALNASPEVVAADSEDDEDGAIPSDRAGFLQKLFVAVAGVNYLKVLDLSGVDSLNSEIEVARLFAGWSSSRPGPQKHVEVEAGILHLFVHGFSCCSPCNFCSSRQL